MTSIILLSAIKYIPRSGAIYNACEAAYKWTILAPGVVIVTHSFVRV